MKWIIVDWTSTRCYSNKKFKSYEDAWDFLYCEYPDDDDALGEYYVIKDSTPHREFIGGLILDTIPNQYSSNKFLENQKVNQLELSLQDRVTGMLINQMTKQEKK